MAKDNSNSASPSLPPLDDISIIENLSLNAENDNSSLDTESDDNENLSLEDLLMKAAKRGDINSVNNFLEQGAEINHQNQDYDTPLILAAEAGHASIVKLLLERGADQGIENKEYDSALTISAQNGHLGVVRLLDCENQDLNDRALLKAAQEGQAKVVKFFLDQGANPTKVFLEVEADNYDSDNDEEYVTWKETALNCAAYNNHAEVVNIIVKHLALLSQKNNDNSFNNEDDLNEYWNLGSSGFERLLSRETATLLVLVFPDGEFLDSAIANFNERNPDNIISIEQNGKISKLRELVESTTAQFLQDQDLRSSAGINDAAAEAPTEEQTARLNNSARRLATIAVGELAANPSQLEEINEILLVSKHLELDTRESITQDINFTDLIFPHFLNNSALTENQNSVFRRMVFELLRPQEIATPLPPTPESKSADSKAAAEEEREEEQEGPSKNPKTKSSNSLSSSNKSQKER